MNYIVPYIGGNVDYIIIPVAGLLQSIFPTTQPL